MSASRSDHQSGVGVTAIALVLAGCSRVVAPDPDEPSKVAHRLELEPSFEPVEPRLSELVLGAAGGCVYVGLELWCWGPELRDLFADLPPYEAVSIDNGRVRLDWWMDCTVRSGKLSCKARKPVALGLAVAVEVYGSQTCVVLENGEVRCRDAEQTTTHGVIEDAVDVEMNAYGVCVRTRAGRVACSGGALPARWGREDAPLQWVPGLDQITELELGQFHGCMADRAGRVRCFGRNDWGQLGSGDTEDHDSDHVVDVRLPGPAVELAVSRTQSCAIVGDEVRCWGALDANREHFGQHEIEFEATALHLQPGSTCATRLDGSLWCWGYSGLVSTVLGHGGAARAAIPEHVTTPLPVTWFHGGSILRGDQFIMVAGEDELRVHGVAGFATDGFDLACVFGGAHGVRCFEDKGTIEPATWVPPRLSKKVSDLTVSRSICAVHGGEVSCLWRRKPRWVAIRGLHDIRSIVDDGDDRVCALANDGRVACWRGSWDDRDGRYEVAEGPYVLGEQDVVEIAWGWELLARSRSGALRSGPATQAGEQLETLIDAGVVEVAGAPGRYGRRGHACARVDRDGDGLSERIACFGDDRVGQLGRVGEHVLLRPTPIPLPQ